MRKVTVGIPAYNEEQNIANLLRSLEEQNTQIFEVIISDDLSDKHQTLCVISLGTRCWTSSFSIMILEGVAGRPHESNFSRGEWRHHRLFYDAAPFLIRPALSNFCQASKEILGCVHQTLNQYQEMLQGGHQSLSQDGSGQ